jgi:protein-tyrosine phosphatase
VRFQGNLGAFTAYYGSVVQERAVFLRESGVYTCYGSDAHDPDRLPLILKGLESVRP